MQIVGRTGGVCASVACMIMTQQYIGLEKACREKCHCAYLCRSQRLLRSSLKPCTCGPPFFIQGSWWTCKRIGVCFHHSKKRYEFHTVFRNETVHRREWKIREQMFLYVARRVCLVIVFRMSLAVLQRRINVVACLVRTVLWVVVLRFRREFFSLSPYPHHLWCLSSLIYSGFQWLRRPVREADRLSLSDSEIKNMWSLPPLTRKYLWCASSQGKLNVYITINVKNHQMLCRSAQIWIKIGHLAEQFLCAIKSTRREPLFHEHLARCLLTVLTSSKYLDGS
jgi:hypothetical protein